MKKYIGIKVIKAEPMTMKEAQKVLGRKIATLKPVTVDENGYLVEYKDGYKSWSPKDVFESAYYEAGDDLDFGCALDLLKAGMAVRRKGWNGKGSFIVKQNPSHIEGDIIPKMLIITDGIADFWVPSSSDVFAEDWEVVYESR